MGTYELFGDICTDICELASRKIGSWPQPGSISSDKVAIIGHDDWVFLYEGSNDYFRSYIMDDQQSTHDAEGWWKYLTCWMNWCELRGIRFVFAVVPNKASVLSDQYPLGLKQTMTFRMSKLLRFLDSHGSNNLVFPLENFRNPSFSKTIFRRNDSHFSEVGVISMAAEIVSKLGFSAKTLRFSGAMMPVRHPGDLGRRFEGGMFEDAIRIRRNLNAINIENLSQPIMGAGFSGLSYETNYELAPLKGRLLVFGNSFFERVPSWGMGPDFARTFSHVRFHWSNSLDKLVIDTWKPDYILLQTCERFLSRVPALPSIL